MAADRTLLVRAGLVVGTIVIGGLAYLVGTNLANDRIGAKPAPSPTPSVYPFVNEKFVEFKDPIAGISFSYPKSWQRLEDNSALPISTESDHPVNRRVVLGPSVDRPLMFARVIPLTGEFVLPDNATEADLANIQVDLSKRWINNPGVRVAAVHATNHKGKLAWRYLYNYTDEATGRVASHVHYFIFDGAKINVLVFEALPTAEIESLAPVFDKILGTFESVPRIIPNDGAVPPPPSQDSTN